MLLGFHGEHVGDLPLFEDVALLHHLLVEPVRVLDPRVGAGLVTHFLCFLFGKDPLTCLEGKSMTPRRERLFSSVPPSNSLGSVSDPRRAF